MIVESSGEISKEIEKILTYPDYKIFTSHNKTDGYKIAVRYQPDLILLHVNGNKDNASFIKKISADLALAAIPLIVISENSTIQEQRELMDFGADDYITFDFLERSLSTSVKNRLSKLSLIKQSIHSSLNTFDEYKTIPQKNDHILIKIGNKLKLIEFSEIICIIALREYSKIITVNSSKIIVRKSLKTWVKTLASETFLRIHRATIININYIEEITKVNERTYTVHLRNIKETFDFSYRYANIMRHTFLK